jgi:hypothetical protein
MEKYSKRNLKFSEKSIFEQTLSFALACTRSSKFIAGRFHLIYQGSQSRKLIRQPAVDVINFPFLFLFLPEICGSYILSLGMQRRTDLAFFYYARSGAL